MLLRPLLQAHSENLQARNLLGIALTGQGRLTEANKEYREILRLDPHFYPALKNLAINEIHLNQFSAAERDFRAALALAPKDPVVHMYLGSLAYRRNDFRSAAHHLLASGQLLHHDANLRLELADSYFHTGERLAGRDMIERLSPQSLSPSQRFVAGYLLAREGFCTGAAPFFQSVPTHDPDSYDAGFNLALCEVEAKQYTQAIQVLKALRAQGHKTTDVDNLLAQAYEGNHQLQEAFNILLKATALAPEDEKYYLDLAKLCIDRRAYDTGVKIISAGLRQLPDDSHLLIERGVLYALWGKLDLAEQDYERAIRVSPDARDKAYAGLALAYLQTGDLSRAIQFLRRRTQEKPNDAFLLLLLGDALVQSGVHPGDPGFRQAQAALERSIKLDPSFARARLDLARIYLKEGRVDDAIVELDHARGLEPKNVAIYALLAVAYRRKGENRQATAMLETVKELNESKSRHDLRTFERTRPVGPSQESTAGLAPPTQP